MTLSISDGAIGDPGVKAALDRFEPLFFNNMTLFSTATSCTESAWSPARNSGVLRGNNVIEFAADRSVSKLNLGDRIRLTAAQFERLSEAFFAEIESKFL